MGEAPCDVLEIELALELLEGELSTELPAHMRAFARAHADGRTPPSAPLIARLASTLETAHAAYRHELLRERGLAILRLVAPLAIEDEPAVCAARAQPPSWDGLSGLAAARDQHARERYSRGAIELLHKLHGVVTVAGDPAETVEPGPAIEGWQDRDTPVEHDAIVDAWHAISTRLGVSGNLRIDRASAQTAVQPRTFVVDPGIEVIVVVPHEIASPASRFAVLHELGHAAAALAQPAGVPRVLDEAVASFVARLAEPPTWLPPRWANEHAAAARRRRTAIAMALDWIERELPAVRAPVGAVPPWALWYDPGAQAAYVAAEVIADRLQHDLGPNPPRGQFTRVLGFERDAIDRRTHV
jgi:hypothetical protein